MSKNIKSAEKPRKSYKAHYKQVEQLISRKKFSQALDLWETLWEQANREKNKLGITGLKKLRKSIKSNYYYEKCIKHDSLGDEEANKQNVQSAINHYTIALEALDKTNLLTRKSEKNIRTALLKDINVLKKKLDKSR